jgi:hypothetical protein
MLEKYGFTTEILQGFEYVVFWMASPKNRETGSATGMNPNRSRSRTSGGVWVPQACGAVRFHAGS